MPTYYGYRQIVAHFGGKLLKYQRRQSLCRKLYLNLMTQLSAYSLTSSDWLNILKKEEQSINILPFWLDGLYKNSSIWEKHISPLFIQNIYKKINFDLPKISQIQESEDNTVKFLIQLRDGLEVESVLIPFHKRRTICLSTQVGCGMNCSFCYTGTQGLKRNLTSDEIIGQYIIVLNWLLKKDPRALNPSIVFMGQGEPLHNADEVHKAILIFNDRKILGLGHRQMTLSTVGYLPNLEKLLEFPKINIAFSLHSPFQEERTKLIPVTAKFPLDSVLRSLDQIQLLPRQFITYEYLLIKNFNMSDRHAEELAHLLSSRKAIINLIPFNPFPNSPWERPEMADIDAFKAKLVEKKLRVMIRTTKGQDILAACGQLKVNKLGRNRE